MREALYVLLFYTGIGHGGGPATAEFYTLEACEYAMYEIRKEWGEHTWAVCVRK